MFRACIFQAAAVYCRPDLARIANDKNMGEGRGWGPALQCYFVVSQQAQVEVSE